VLQAYKARVDIIDARRTQLAALGAAHGADADVQRTVLRKAAGLQALFAFLHGTTSIAIHASLLGPEQHAALVVSAAPFVPAPEHLHAALFGAGGGGGGASSGVAPSGGVAPAAGGSGAAAAAAGPGFRRGGGPASSAGRGAGRGRAGASRPDAEPNPDASAEPNADTGAGDASPAPLTAGTS
jgi:hypothetical protein